MAVPTSGALSLGGIRKEVSYSNYSQPVSILNISLSDVSTGVNGTLNTSSSSRPDGSTPHKMSEWYGYDHDYSALISFSSGPVATTGALACAQGAPSATYYHDGSGTFPAVGDNVYTNSFGTTALSNGFYKIFTQYMQVSNGAVTLINNCR